MAARKADGVFSIDAVGARHAARDGRSGARSASRRIWHARSGHLEHGLDLDRGVERQRRDADGGARVPALVAERRDHQVGGAVHHLGAVEESRAPN